MSNNKPLVLEHKARQEPTLDERTDEAVTTVKEIIEDKNDVELEAGPVVDRFQLSLDEEPVKGNSSRKLLRRPGIKCPRQLDL